MSKNKKYHQLYDRLLQEVEMLHERIKVGIRQGLKMLVIWGATRPKAAAT